MPGGRVGRGARGVANDAALDARGKKLIEGEDGEG